MNKVYLKLNSLLIAIIMIVCLGLTASADNTYVDLSANKTVYEANEESTIKMYSTTNGVATLLSNNDFNFSSSNPKAFSVEETGVIKALKAGRSTITVTSKTNSALTNKFIVICYAEKYTTTEPTKNIETITDPAGIHGTVKNHKGATYDHSINKTSIFTLWFYDKTGGLGRFALSDNVNDGEEVMINLASGSSYYQLYNFNSSKFTDVSAVSTSIIRSKGWHQLAVVNILNAATSKYEWIIYIDSQMLVKFTHTMPMKYLKTYGGFPYNFVDVNCVVYDNSDEPVAPSASTEMTGIDISGLITSYNLEEGVKNTGTVKKKNTTTTPSWTDIDGISYSEKTETVAAEEITSGLSFVSDKSQVCTVDNNGNLTPISAGVANITVSYESFNETVKVLIKPAPIIEKVLDISEITKEFEMKSDGASVGNLLSVGKKIYEKSQTVRPDYDFGDFKADKENIGEAVNTDITSSVAYSSDNGKITVDESGNVSATENGIANIKITYGELSESVKILVKPAPIIEKKIDISKVTKSFFGNGTIGEISLITTTTIPSYTDLNGDPAGGTVTPVTTPLSLSELTYNSLNPEICTVGADGSVTIADSGTAKIEISYDGLKETVTIESYSQQDIDNIVSTLQKSDITIGEIETMVTTLGLNMSDISNKAYIYNYLQSNKADYNTATEFTTITDAFKTTFNEAKTNVLALETSLETAKAYLETNKTALGIDGTTAYNYFVTASETIQTNIVSEIKKVTSDSEIKGILNNNAVKIAFNSLINYSQVEDVVEKFAAEIGIDMTAYNALNSQYKAYVQQGMFNARSTFTDNTSIATKFNALVANPTGGSGGGSGGGGSSGGGFVSNSKPSSNTSTITGTFVADSKNEEAYKLPEWVQEERQAELAAENIFSDLSQAEWAREYVKDLYKNNIVSGYSDGTFGVNKSITREEVVKLLVESGKLKHIEDAENVEFSDVNPSAWYYDYVKIAVENGVINGIGNNMFGVGQPITREEMAAMMYRLCDATGVILIEEITIFPFSDQEEISDWAEFSVTVLRESFLIDGFENRFNPKDNLTRAQAAKLIYGYLHYND